MRAPEKRDAENCASIGIHVKSCNGIHPFHGQGGKITPKSTFLLITRPAVKIPFVT